MSGVRIEVTRGDDSEKDGSFVYRGTARTESAEVPIEIVAAVAGASARCLEPREEAVRIEKMAQALVRAATRAELEEGRLPPRKIVRWRAL